MKSTSTQLMVALLSVLAGAAGGAWAQQPKSDGRVHNLGATITGNQEQPKVLYIVPWKAAYEDTAIPYRPISGQTDNVFRHVERHEHQRHLDFLEELGAGE